MIDPDGGDGPLDARKARLIDALEDTKKLNTSTTLATAGSTQSKSSASSTRNPASFIHA